MKLWQAWLLAKFPKIAAQLAADHEQKADHADLHKRQSMLLSIKNSATSGTRLNGMTALAFVQRLYDDGFVAEKSGVGIAQFSKGSTFYRPFRNGRLNDAVKFLEISDGTNT